jgi:hypothetical protein
MDERDGWLGSPPRAGGRHCRQKSSSHTHSLLQGTLVSSQVISELANISWISTKTMWLLNIQRKKMKKHFKCSENAPRVITMYQGYHYGITMVSPSYIKGIAGYYRSIVSSTFRKYQQYLPFLWEVARGGRCHKPVLRTLFQLVLGLRNGSPRHCRRS